MKKKTEIKDLKVLSIRLPQDIWSYIKKSAVDDQISINAIIIKCLEKYKKDRENYYSTIK